MAAVQIDDRTDVWKPSVDQWVLYLVLFGLVGGRIMYGELTGDPLNTVTLFGINGGLLGGYAMLFVHEYYGVGRIGPELGLCGQVLADGDPVDVARPAMYLYVTGAMVAGALYPRLVFVTVGNAPLVSVSSGVLLGGWYGVFLGVMALGAGVVGLYDFELESRDVRGVVGGYVVYGLVVGSAVGLYGWV